MSYQVLARKYRPATFEQMVGQEHVLKALVNALDSNRLHHAYLFTGTRGVGKTSLARLFAKSLNCEQGVSSTPCGQCSNCSEIAQGRFVDLIEVDAASRTKVEDTRELLENVQYAPSKGRFKVYLIDEVHMLSSHSFNALLKTLEEPPPHIKFLLATTDPQKLPVTILSRCLQFNLKNMTPERVVDHLQTVLQAENLPYEEPALWLLGRAADGSMRDALSLTDQAIAYSSGALVEADVRSMLGSVDQHQVMQILERLADQDAAGVMARVAQMAEYGFDSDAILAELLNLLHRVAMAQMLPGSVDNSLGDREQMLAVAARLRGEDVQLFYQIGLSGRRDLPLVPVARDGLEMTLLRMLAFRPVQPGEVALPQSGNAAAAANIDAPQSTTSAPAAAMPEAHEPKASAATQSHGVEHKLSETAVSEQPQTQNTAISNTAIQNTATQNLAENHDVQNRVAQQKESRPADAFDRPAAHPEPVQDTLGRGAASQPAMNQAPPAFASGEQSSPASHFSPPSSPPGNEEQGVVVRQDQSARLAEQAPTAPTSSHQEPPPWDDAPPWGDGAPHQPQPQQSGGNVNSGANNATPLKKPSVRTPDVEAFAQGQTPLNTAPAADSLSVQHKTGPVAASREPVQDLAPVPAAEPAVKLSVVSPVESEVDSAQTAASATPSIAVTATPPEQGAQSATVPQPSDAPIIDRLADLNGSTWIGLLDKLGLTGMTYNIAANASIKSVTADVVTLLVLPQQMSLFNDTHRSRIELALNDYFSSTVRVDVESGEPEQETPAQHQERCRLERLALAVSAMENDSTVQQLISRYDARLDVGSIKPID